MKDLRQYIEDINLEAVLRLLYNYEKDQVCHWRQFFTRSRYESFECPYTIMLYKFDDVSCSITPRYS